MTRRPMLIGCLLIVALLLTAPVGSAGPKGKVVIWYDSGAAWNPFIADFNKELAAQYPDVTVEWVTQDAAQLSAKLVAAFATKQGPDIALGSQYRLVAVEQQFKVWADLSPRLATDPELEGDRRRPAQGSRRRLLQRQEAVGAAAGRPVGRPVRAEVVGGQGEGQGARGLGRADGARRALHPGGPGRERPGGHLRLLHLRGAGRHEQLRHPVPVHGRGRRDAAPDRGRRREAVVQHRRRARGGPGPPPLAAREEGHVAGDARPSPTRSSTRSSRPASAGSGASAPGTSGPGPSPRWPRTTW